MCGPHMMSELSKTVVHDGNGQTFHETMVKLSSYSAWRDVRVRVMRSGRGAVSFLSHVSMVTYPPLIRLGHSC